MYPETKEEIAEYKKFMDSLEHDPDKDAKLNYFIVHKDIELMPTRIARYEKELASHKTWLSRELYILGKYLKGCHPKIQLPLRSPISLGRITPYYVHRRQLLENFEKYDQEADND